MTTKTEPVITTEIKEYSQTASDLSKLHQELSGVVFDCSTGKGMKEAKSSRMMLVKTRTGLEAIRKEIKAPALAHCQMIDSEARRITAEITALEEPIAAQIKIEEDRKAEIAARKAAKKAAKEEAERLEREEAEAAARAETEKWQHRIEAIKRRPLDFIGVESATIKTAIEKASMIDVDGWPEELQDAAGDALAGAIEQMKGMFESAVATEVNAARIKELEAQKPAPAPEPEPVIEQDEPAHTPTAGEPPLSPVTEQVRPTNIVATPEEDAGESPAQDTPHDEEGSAGRNPVGEFIAAGEPDQGIEDYSVWDALLEAAEDTCEHFGKFRTPHETIVALIKAIDAVKSV